MALIAREILWSVASEVISDPASAKIYGVDTETTIGKVWQKKPKEVAHTLLWR